MLPKSGESQGTMVIEGLLTYNDGNENKLAEVKELNVALEDLTLTEKQNLLLTGEIPSGAKKSDQVAQKEPVKTPAVIETKPDPVTSRQPVSKAGSVSSTGSGSSGTSGNSGGSIKGTRVLSSGTGVYFRIQLSANRRSFDGRTHFRNAGVDREVFVEEHNGLFKYTAGSFQTYGQALSYKKQVEKLPDIKGAFIVAYRDGKRIPVSSTR